MNKIAIYMPCLFGLEKIAANEVKFKLGREAKCEDGKAWFYGEPEDIARANINISTVERVQILLGRFEARSFDELFEGVKRLPLEDYIEKDGAFPVKGWSLDSALRSLPDCQSIVKKAVVERLKQRYNVAWFAETGAEFPVHFNIHKDVVSVFLDTSGAPLHRRGYRAEGGAAPIRETLAAAIADCARVRLGDHVYDPCCGSGTLLIEAARKAMGIAPGIDRKFISQGWNALPKLCYADAFAEARAAVKPAGEFACFGGDIDESVLATAAENAKKAGVGGCVSFQRRDVKDFAFTHSDRNNIVVANPPYGERLADAEYAEKFYACLGKKFLGSGARCFYISSSEDFEGFYGAVADKRRKVYNGMIRCWLYMFYKQGGGHEV